MVLNRATRVSQVAGPQGAPWHSAPAPLQLAIRRARLGFIHHGASQAPRPSRQGRLSQAARQERDAATSAVLIPPSEFAAAAGKQAAQQYSSDGSAGVDNGHGSASSCHGSGAAAGQGAGSSSQSSSAAAGAQLHPRQLTARIARCGSWQALQQLLLDNWGALSAIHTSAAVTRLAHLGPGEGASSTGLHGAATSASMDAQLPSPAFVAQLLGALSRLAAHMEERQLANTTWALGRLLSSRPLANARWRGEALQVLAQLAELAPAKLANAQAQEVANLLYGFALAGHHPGPACLQAAAEACGRQWPRFKPQELASLLWALATLRFPPPRAWQQQFFRACTDRGHRAFQPRELSMLLWASAKLGCQPDAPWIDSVLAAVQAQLLQGGFKGPELAATAWALDALRCRPGPAFMHALLMQASLQLPALQPRHLINLLHSLQAMDTRISQEWLDQFLAAAASRFDAPGNDDLVSFVVLLQSSGARAQAPPLQQSQQQLQPAGIGSGAANGSGSGSGGSGGPQWLPSLAALALRKAADFTPHDCAQLMCVLARMQPCPGRPAVGAALLAAYRQLPHATGRQLANMLWAAAKLQERLQAAEPGAGLPDDWLRRAVAAAFARLGEMGPQEKANAMWALGRLRRSPDPLFVEELLDSVVERLPEYSTGELAQLVWGAAWAGHRPPLDWLAELAEELQPRLLQQRQQQPERGGSGNGRAGAGGMGRPLSLRVEELVMLCSGWAVLRHRRGQRTPKHAAPPLGAMAGRASARPSAAGASSSSPQQHQDRQQQQHQNQEQEQQEPLAGVESQAAPSGAPTVTAAQALYAQQSLLMGMDWAPSDPCDPRQASRQPAAMHMQAPGRPASAGTLRAAAAAAVAAPVMEAEEEQQLADEEERAAAAYPYAASSGLPDWDSISSGDFEGRWRGGDGRSPDWVDAAEYASPTAPSPLPAEVQGAAEERDAAWFHWLQQTALGAAAAQGCQTRHLASLAWSYGLSGLLPPPAWLQAFAAHSAPVLLHAQPQELCAMAQAFARVLRQQQVAAGAAGEALPLPLVPTVAATANAAGASGSGSGPSGAELPAPASASMLDPSWTRAYLSAVKAALPRFGPHEVVLVLVSLVRLGVAPDQPLLHQMLAMCLQQATTLRGTDLVRVVWALAELRQNPGQQWLRLLTQQAVEHLGEMDRLEEQSMALSLASLNTDLAELWAVQCSAAEQQRRADAAAEAAAAAAVAANGSESDAELRPAGYPAAVSSPGRYRPRRPATPS